MLAGAGGRCDRRRAGGHASGGACARGILRSSRPRPCAKRWTSSRPATGPVLPRENALFNLLAAFSVTFGLARLSTWSIRRRGTLGPVSQRQGRATATSTTSSRASSWRSSPAASSVALAERALDAWLALPFGAGVALTLDESALLLELDDVYWSERGIVSVQITLTAMLMLSGLALGLRLLRRGEAEVL